MNSKGSTIVMVLILAGALMTSGLIILGMSSNLAKTQKQKFILQHADSIAQSISAALSNRGTCLAGFDDVGPEPGLQFVGAGGNFNFAQASTANGQNIIVPGVYRTGGPGTRQPFASGSLIPGADMIINRLYIANAVADSTSPNTFNVKVMANIQSTLPDIMPFRPRPIVDLRIQTNGTAMTDCNAVASATNNQMLCEGMGCTYSVSASGQGNCLCPIQPTTCTGGTYVESIVNFVPQCSTATISRSCASAPDSFLVALDPSGNAICGTVVRCPTGTDSNGLGGIANPPECKCSGAGETWDGSSCAVIPIIAGVCGGANSGTFVDAATANAAGLCSAGTASPASLAGVGPWSWACNGSGGGSNAACSASLAPLCPAGTSAGGAGAVAVAGCNCNNSGETWNGASCVPASYLSGCGCSACPNGVEDVFPNGTVVSPPTATNYFWRFCRLLPGQLAYTSFWMVNSPPANWTVMTPFPLNGIVSSNQVSNSGIVPIKGAYCHFTCNEAADPGQQCSGTGPSGNGGDIDMCWYIKPP